MEVLTAITGKVAELTVTPIGRQVGYLLSYKENFKELKEKSEELKARKIRIDHVVKAEIMNGREIEADVKIWQKRVAETLEEVEKFCGDEPHASIWCWKWSFINLKSRHQLGRKAKKMTFTIDEMMKEKWRFDSGVGYVDTSNRANLVFATRDSEKIESRNSLRKEVMLSLTDPKVSKVGIYGWGGVGKTTFAKEIAKHVKDDKVFDLVVMATISQTLNVEGVQDEMAYQLGLQLDEKTSVGRADRLCARIKMEKNILIILDDLWDKIELDKLGIPSDQQDLKGGKLSLTSKRSEFLQKSERNQCCKLLLTSRRLDVLQKNDTQKNFTLEALNNAEAWSLFEDMIGDGIGDPDMQNIATQVVERCAGLPVMIVSIAKSLKYNKDIYYWKDALNRLKRVDGGDMSGIVFSAFEFTYNQLEDDEMKKVFLLCGVHGPSMWLSDLLKYVIGLGVLKHIDTIDDARNRLYRIIHDLKASCLLLEDDTGDSDVIKMHDLICEVAISIAYKNENILLKRNNGMPDWLSNGFDDRCTQIILETCFIQELPQKLNCPNLKFLLLDCSYNYTMEIPDTFFEEMGSLETLKLTNLIISSLPTSLVSLTKFKTLCLHQCTLDHMAGIGALINLKVLSIFDSLMEEFPSEMGHLTNLRMLDLSYSKIEVFAPNTLSKLTKLEELYMGNASIKWEEESSRKKKKCVSIAELGCLKNLTALEIHIYEAWIFLGNMTFDKLQRYKIVIGDKWKLFGRKRISRLLKLKLVTSIHSEHGIKALIKRVEDLYLDEVSGILDVLFDLNEEGFPFLKHLYIRNNGQVRYISNTTVKNESHILFPKLEKLILRKLSNLTKICHGPLPVNSFCKLTLIKVQRCDQLVYLFSVLMVKALSQLVELQVYECSSIKSIVFIENEDNGTEAKIEFHSLRSLSLRQLPLIRDFCSNQFTLLAANLLTSLFNGSKVSFPSLETLKLSFINLEKIWDGNHLFAPNFQNLTNLIVEDCRGIKYLITSSLIGSLLKLKHLEISKCEMMEEIIATKTGNTIASQDEVQFSKLETIIIKDMKSLKKVWHFQFERLKTLEVSNCEKLVKIFPSDMQRTFGSLEILKVSNCDSMEEIFELCAKEIQSEHEATTLVSQLKTLHLLGLPNMKQIWSRDAHQANLRFHNLQLVCVEHCGNLEYLFPFSIAMQAAQLEHVAIKYAWSMKQIVSDKECPTDGPIRFEFKHLTALVFWLLFKLEGLFSRNHSLHCPLLREIDIRGCSNLKIFKTQSTSGPESSLDSKLQITTIQQPLFTIEEVICNLEKLTLNSEEASIILHGPFSGGNFSKLKVLYLTNFDASFPYWFLQNITTLNVLAVESSSFHEIFKDKKGKSNIKTRIGELLLNVLPHLTHICKEGFQIDPVLEVLEYLIVRHCSKLKHLVPSSVTFSHLTYLEVEDCHGLTHLITSSTARSLVKLTTMKIKSCNLLEQVVVEEREGSEDEIAFSSLEILELECLPMTKTFCSSNCLLDFPLLVKVSIKQCPRMSTFSVNDTSTPMLQEILSKEEVEKLYWKRDLNRTIHEMFQDMVAFHSFEHLELSQYPEIKELWYHNVQPEVYGNLKSLVVHKCDFISDVLLPLNLVQVLSKLEELQVNECNSLEAVFDLSVNMDQKEVFCKETIQLKKIILSRLPNLKHIWKENFQGTLSFRETIGGHMQQHRQPFYLQPVRSPVLQNPIWRRNAQANLSFHNLQLVWVEHCNNLEYLFPFSIAMQATQLENITIKYAGSMKQIVSNKEGHMDSTVKFEFNHLDSLILWDLYELKGFFAGIHSVLCPILRELDIRRCGKFKPFKIQSSSGPETVSSGNQMSIMHHHLFTLEEVICSLEKLTLNSEDASMILQGRYSGERFSKLKFLCLTNFEDDHATFPYWLLQNITTVTILLVELSSFQEIFQDEKGRSKIKTRIETLILNQLRDLQHICKEGFQIDPVLEVLQYLYVYHCSKLKQLVPSSVTFSHLTYLEVKDCNGLLQLITSSTARSLVKLTTMKINNCNSLEQVLVEVREGSVDKIAFNNLNILELECLPMIKMFCSSGCFLDFPSLKEVIVKQCPRMNIFSVNDTSTPMLQKILSNEEEEEKIYWEGDLNKTINRMFVDMVAFHNFKHLELSQYPEIRELWYNYVQPEAYGNLKSLVVHKCDFLSDVLLPLNLVQALFKLEELQVSECNSLKAVFDLTNMDKKGELGEEAIQLKRLNLSSIPRLKHVWKQNFQEHAYSRETTDGDDIQHQHPAYSFQQVRLPELELIPTTNAQANLRFPNLQLVWVERCENLEYLFPFSIAMQATQLENITIKYAGSMKQIVSNKEGHMDSPVKFEFIHLDSLTLWDLYELKGFFSGNHSVLCSRLKELDIRKCMKLKPFKTQSSSDPERIFDSKLKISIQQPLFILEEVICNLEKLTLNREDASMILQGRFSGEHFSKLKFICLTNFEDDQDSFPYWFLQNITTLNKLLVERSSFQEIFQDGKGKSKIKTQIEELTLNQLHDLRHICEEGFQIDPILEVLQYLYVYHCSKLKHLLPSSVAFSHLTYLEVGYCHGLTHLITSSTARSLVKLTKMKIWNCNSLEQVVAEERGGLEDDIIFSSLEILELISLPMIKRFFSCNCFLNLPLLKEVFVTQCPRMNIFSRTNTNAPNVQKISSKEGDEKEYWEGDLNRTINKMFVDMVAFSGFKYLELSQYPELEELWYGQVGHKIFCNLKHLVVHKCTFLSNTIFPSNLLQLLYALEELEVAECDLIEVVFDAEALDNKAMGSMEVSRLKKLTLSELSNLKHIWSREASEMINFGNLHIVKVGKCPKLKYLFSPSLCQNLKQLEVLDIKSCGVEQIVASEEGLEELNFYFPRLKTISLRLLRQLKDFYPKSYTLECPSLKVLDVGQQFIRGVTVDLPILHDLFNIEKVPKHLEDLSLNEKDARRILSGHYERELFQRIKTLRLQYFQETPIKFLNELLESFPGAISLHVRWSSFETLIPTVEISHFIIKKPTQIKKLWLFQLEELEHIWNENSASDALVSNLEYLFIGECSRLIRLAPPLTSFTNLTTLMVRDCNGLMYFVTSFTAKSLVHLRRLTVKNCMMLEEIVVTNEGGSKEEIIIESLKYLELTCLSRFKCFCFGEHSFIFPSLVIVKVIGCHKMQNFSPGTTCPFLKVVEVEDGRKRWKGDLNSTIKHLFIEKTNENLNVDTTEGSSSKEQVGGSKAKQIADTVKQETHKLPNESINREQNEQSLSGIEGHLALVTQDATIPSTNQDAEELQDSKTQSSMTQFKEATTANNEEIIGLAKGTQEMGENIERPMVEAAKIAHNPTRVYGAGVNEFIENLLSKFCQEEQGQATVQDIGSPESETCPRENLSSQTETFITNDKEETIGTQEIHDTMDKPLAQTDQDAEKLATIQNTEESHGSDIGTQRICHTIKKASSPTTTQDVSNSTMISKEAIDSSPSQAAAAMISPTQKSNIYRNYKGMIDIPEHNIPYLEAGVNRHPQVLDWLNTKRRRVLASSTFSLFAEVTCILRTTQKGHLTEDDRNYIMECCSVLETVGFDASWLSHVYKCIEECGDAEDIKRKVEETKGQVSSLKAQIESMKKELATAEESLELLLDKARDLDDFIES